MSLWGNKDLVTSTGTIGIAYTNGLVTGNGTNFVSAGIHTGNVVKIGAGATYGFAVVKSVASNTEMTIYSDDYFVTTGSNVAAGAAYEVSEEPLYAMADATYAGPEERTTGFSTSPVTRVIYGVDEIEQQVANDASGDARKYAPPHTGWVGITTYTDTHGNLRVKHEVLVAGGILTTSDAADSGAFPNS
jgi:hypothetical protein|tara:strand:+ start:122 stop:688 length:567 start_codon:yes stop_codon:yes gene_type:complete